jgi:CSLREA domain-containing protein
MKNRLVITLILTLAVMFSTVWIASGRVSSAIHVTGFTVNSTLDEVDNNLGDGLCATASGVCTLRAAIQETNALTGHNTIVLPADTYHLTDSGTGSLTITDDLTISVLGEENATIRGADGWNSQILSIVNPGIQVTISNVTIENGLGSEGGGIFNRGNLILENATIRNNRAYLGFMSGDGGGIFNSQGNLTLKNSTVSNNTVMANNGYYGGGIYSYEGSLTILNSTISGNRANNHGGGIYSYGTTVTMNNVTIAHNQAGTATGNYGFGAGIYIASGSFTIQNTIIAGNTLGNGGKSDCYGTLISEGHNLIENTQSCTITGNTAGNILGLGAKLEPLTDNAGSTETHALQWGSPAIDAGNNDTCLPTDQRGVARPMDGIGNRMEVCDIGAVEMHAWAHDFVYLPVVAQPPDSDLLITGIEVTQAIQDMNNTVPLVQGRKTLVRIYPQTTGQYPVPNVLLELDIYHGQTLVATLTAEEFTVQTAPARTNLAYSFNSYLPEELLVGEVTLVARVDADNRISELNETNNEFSITVSFSPVPPLHIKIVPINYIHAPTGAVCPAPASIDVYSDFVMRSYPVSEVNVSFRTPVDFVGDLTIDSESTRLLQQITDLKHIEGAPASQVYYGIFPLSQSCPLGVGGKGWIGHRVAIGHENSGVLMAHEIGHNFGLRHAPCNGSDGSVDPNYPYPEGSIGEYGVDVFNLVLYSPVGPNYATDVMSYRCQYKWFSDYHYRKLHADQVSNGVFLNALTQTEVLMIRVLFDAEENAVIKPVYAGPGIPTRLPKSSDYTVELLDKEGNVHFVQAVEPTTLASDSLSGAAINANIGYGKLEEISRIRLIRNGDVLAERELGTELWSPGNVFMQVDERAEAVLLGWNVSAAPVLVRFSHDNGHTWITLGLDVVGGELLIPFSLLPEYNGYFQVTLADRVAATHGELWFSPTWRNPERSLSTSVQWETR